MGQQLSVEAFSSTADTEGHKYWASFDPYPFKVGSRKLVYMGMLNGDGPLRGHKCVVKTLRRGNVTKTDWLMEAKCAKVAREMAQDYNRIIPSQGRKVFVNCPIMAEVDTLSDCMCVNDIVGKPKKKLKEMDFVSMEVYLKGKFEDFEYGWHIAQEDLYTPEAFSHFTWCKSEGTMFVSNLQGTKHAHSYHFTGPVIHSDDMTYGGSDQGYEGIKGFFRLHKCNHICRHWPRLGDGTDLRGWGDLFGARSCYPSAPPLPPDGPAPPPYEESYFSLGTAPSTNRHTEESPGRHVIPAPAQGQQTMGRQGIMFDWREEFMNYNQSNGVTNMGNLEQMYGMQFMWFVSKMTYANYPPPPPYCTCAMRKNQTEQENGRDGVSEEHEYNHDDVKYCLPPPYSEENVHPDKDMTTYL